MLTILRAASTCAAFVLVALGATGSARAATNYLPVVESAQSRTTPGTADVALARQAIAAGTGRVHLLRTTGDRRVDAFNTSQMSSPMRAIRHQASVGAAPPAIIYPDDLLYNGGPVMPNAELYSIYVNCTSRCWGDPATFLGQLSKSNWIHDIDQYVGSSANDRYPYVGNISENVPSTTKVLYQNDILAIVHAAVVRAGNKPYKSVYDVFLPKGIDTCTSAAACYSPDAPATFAFCGYHGSVTFSDVGHVIYSVLPYADVNGCTLLASSPNGLLIDATNSVLSHETFELLTDPDLNAWYTFPFKSEIGDNCAYLYNFETLVGTMYEVQTEYSNIAHGCVADYIP